MPKFLTIAEFATVARVTPQTVRNQIRKGTIPAVRFGRFFRVPEDALHARVEPAMQEKVA